MVSDRPFPGLIALLLCCCTLQGAAQKNSQAKLEAEKAAITARIAATQALLKSARDDQQRTTGELAILKEDLALRQQLLSNLERERRRAEQRLEARKSSVEAADGQLRALKEEYAGMIRLAARLESQDALWSLLLDAEGAVQVLRRLLLIEEYGRSRRAQADMIAASTASLRGELDSLRRERASLVDVEGELRSERDAARQGARRQEVLLSELRSQELSLIHI